MYINTDMVKGGDLYKLLAKMKVMTEQQAFKVIIQIMRAIDIMHRKNILHRDLKLDNVLMVNPDLNELTLKICDFGLCGFF